MWRAKFGFISKTEPNHIFFKNQSCLYIQDHIISVKKKLSKLGMEQNPILFYYSNASSGKKLALLIKCISNLGLKGFKTYSEKPVS